MALTKPRAYQIYDIDYKQAVRVVSTSNITLAGGAPNAVDGVNLSLNDRILVVGQSSGVQNGIYYVTTLGSGANGTWARSVDTNTTGELLSGTIVMVSEGSTYADTQWKLTTNDPITLGVTALTFVQNYLANSISYGSTAFAIASTNANATISVAGTPNVAVYATTGEYITGLISASGNITSAGNITGGNILTAGIASVTGTITTGAATNSTGFAVGNGAVSNVGLGFFPTSGTRGDYAIRDYSSVTSTMYLDVGMGGSASGEFQFRTSNAFTLMMRANTTGVYTPGIMSATGSVYGFELWSTESTGDEGGQINLSKAVTNTTLAGNVVIDVYQNKIRFFENGGTNRGAYIDLTAAAASIGTNLLAGGGGGTPGGANTQVQFNDAGAFGGNGAFVYNKATSTLTVSIVAANNNGAGTNFQVGDDAWIGDINVADTLGIKGQQNPANGYIIFGNSDATGKLGRAGTGPLTYAGAFSATGNVTGGNILTGGIISATGNVSGGNVAAATAIFSLGTLGSTGNITGGNLLTAGIVSAASHIGTLVSVTGNVNGGNLISAGTITTTGNIVNAGANAVANIGAVGAYFNTVHAKATSAQYADVAEYYSSDANYNPGTVVIFGGDAEITIANHEGDDRVAGVVSTNPAYIMNAGIQSTHAVPVALTGRVPTRVVGPVRKGNMMISTTNGYAKACATPSVGTVIGKAIENFDGDIGIIEVVIGRV